MDNSGFFKNVLVIGLGLIGGSIVKALRLYGFTGHLVGIEPNLENRLCAQSSGLLNATHSSLAEMDAEPDLIILAVPLGALEGVFKQLKPLLKKETLITDVGSVKETVHKLANVYLKDNDALFIGGHPMAGSEKGGFLAAKPILFENAYYFLTPNDKTDTVKLKGLQDMVRSIGAIPVVTTPEEHDALTARLSHLPHLAASLLVNVFSNMHPEKDLKYAGSGFRDTTRIAMGNSTLWRDIFFHNKEQLVLAIDSLAEELQCFKQELMAANSPAIIKCLEKAKNVRSELPVHRPMGEASLYPLILDVEDKTGILAKITGLLAKENLNIKDIALDHARENKSGALILSFSCQEDRSNAFIKITEAGLCPVFIEQD